MLGRDDGVVGGETSCKLPAGETAVSPPKFATTGVGLYTTVGRAVVCTEHVLTT